VGLLPGDGGCHLLPRLVGKAKALELLWTGDFVNADAALPLGMVNAVYPDAEFERSAQAFVAKIAAAPPLATRMIKRAGVHGESMTLAASLDLISSHQVIVQSAQDSREAKAAFREKRPGNCVGRPLALDPGRSRARNYEKSVARPSPAVVRSSSSAGPSSRASHCS
jgi:enoyl-CoA hydratase/carnithine racemase